MKYKPCKYAPDGQHTFVGEDDRCMDCDCKPWYVSIRADHPDGAPVDPVESFASAVTYAAYRPIDHDEYIDLMVAKDEMEQDAKYESFGSDR